MTRFEIVCLTVFFPLGFASFFVWHFVLLPYPWAAGLVYGACTIVANIPAAIVVLDWVMTEMPLETLVQSFSRKG